MRLIVLILCMLFSSLSMFSSKIYEGKIIDEETGKAVVSAVIHYKNHIYYSDSEGKFVIEDNSGVSDKGEITISHINYEICKRCLPESENIIIKLKPKPLIIGEITVNSKFNRKTTQSQIITDPVSNVCQSKDVGDLFKDVAGFGVVKRGGYAMEPVLRNFKYEQLNVQYDGGLRIEHACSNRMDPITTHVMPEEVEKIEVIKGPFSVRHGQSMGGIINILTHTPRPAEGISFTGNAEQGYETNGNSKITRISTGILTKKLGLVINGGLKDFGDYEDGNGNETPASFTSKDYSVKANFTPNTNNTLQLMWRQSFADDVMHAGLPMDTKEDVSSVFSLDYGLKNITKKLNAINFKGYYAYVDHVMLNHNRPNFKMVDAVASVEALTTGGKVEAMITPAPKSLLYLGFDAKMISKDGQRVRKVKMMNGMKFDPPKVFTDLIWQDSYVDNYGLYSEFSTNVKDKLLLTIGARYDRVVSDIKNPADDFKALYGGLGKSEEDNFSANVSLNYSFGKSSLILALGRGSRTASLVERYINHFSIGMDMYEYVGNPELKPEINNQIELSFTNKTKISNVNASVYYSAVEDHITAQVDQSIPRKYMKTVEPTVSKRFVNVDKAYITGFELNGGFEVIKNLTLGASMHYIYAHNDTWDEPLAETPPVTVNLSVKYNAKYFWSEIKGRYSAKQDRVAKSFGEKESEAFEVIDFKVGAELIKGLNIGVAVMNIFDKAYYEHLNRSYKNSDANKGPIYEPGRNFSFYVKYRFGTSKKAKE